METYTYGYPELSEVEPQHTPMKQILTVIRNLVRLTKSMRIQCEEDNETANNTTYQEPEHENWLPFDSKAECFMYIMMNSSTHHVVTLRFYVIGNFLQVLGDTGGVDKGTASRVGERFTNLVARWSGSAHDSHMLRTSNIRTVLERDNDGLQNGIRLGNSGYACKSYLITLYLRPSDQSKERYNGSHCRTRVTIERAFCWLKRRFHCLHGEIRMHHERAFTIIEDYGTAARGYLTYRNRGKRKKRRHQEGKSANRVDMMNMIMRINCRSLRIYATARENILGPAVQQEICTSRQGLFADARMPRRRRPANNQAAPARNLRRRGPQLNENEQPPQRRRRNDQHVEVVQDLNMPNPVQPNLDNDIQVAAPVPQPIGEVDDTIVFDEPNMLPNINETDIFISQTVKEKIWQFQYIDLSIMHKSNFSSQFDKQSYLGLNEDGAVDPTVFEVKTIIRVAEPKTKEYIAHALVLRSHKNVISYINSYLGVLMSMGRGHRSGILEDMLFVEYTAAIGRTGISNGKTFHCTSIAHHKTGKPGLDKIVLSEE
ncbi:HARBI1 [Mytilus edulis]|uniref:HARBI1 n=1 Tax=Mytilus edulis TaxID=6550 RepID=A0A8S3QC87_MYTED|nr:HARBI1 [Mytilus edulis]